ncbi:ATP-binding protein [uncultured Ferrimonas sp.]|uniref:ATP-binding protein n=1 Tax=uncultured Ferrimonas sp. TaxID=432640 RepID=UPI0026236F33|nr:ATP-binding protein [uncultured Ferrimonas sp.]
MSRYYGALLVMLLLILLGCALLLKLLLPDAPTVMLDAAQLPQLLASQSACLAQGQSCALVSAQQLPSDLWQREPEIDAMLAQGELVFLGDSSALYQQGQQLYQLQFPALPQEEPVPVALLFYGLVTLAFALLIMPLFITLTRLNNVAAQFSRTGKPVTLTVGRHSFVYPLVTSFNQMTLALSELMQLQKELSATVCHEVRTPLSRITFISAMFDELTVEDARQKVDKQCQQIDAVISEYLNFAAEQRHQPKLKSTLLQPLLEPVLSNYQDLLEIELQLPTGATVQCDPVSLRRAINNLLGNASKFAQQRVSVVFRQSADRYQLCVSDDGPGIESQDDLLQPFVRGDASKPGYGLGLAIVQRVMQWHDGDVQIGRCADLGGASVSLSWPVQRLIEP